MLGGGTTAVPGDVPPLERSDGENLTGGKGRALLSGLQCQRLFFRGKFKSGSLDSAPGSPSPQEDYSAEDEKTRPS
jgi:hypothetical protein